MAVWMNEQQFSTYSLLSFLPVAATQKQKYRQISDPTHSDPCVWMAGSRWCHSAGAAQGPCGHKLCPSTRGPEFKLQCQQVSSGVSLCQTVTLQEYFILGFSVIYQYVSPHWRTGRYRSSVVSVRTLISTSPCITATSMLPHPQFTYSYCTVHPHTWSSVTLHTYCTLHFVFLCHS